MKNSLDLHGELTAAQRCILAVDTSDLQRAQELATIACQAGASIIKQGLELSSSPGSSWEVCSRNAAEAGLDWIADTKIPETPNTTAQFMRNIVRLAHLPIGMTIHAHSGIKSLEAAQKIANEAKIVLFGVTELTSVSEDELRESYAEIGLNALPKGVSLRSLLVRMYAHKAATAGLGGLVASANELVDVKADPKLATKLTLIPGTRSRNKAAHDQQNVKTPYQAILDGADLLVVGRQVTESADPAAALRDVIEEVRRGLDYKLTKKS